jgi:oxaloacetate decarboxylase gamma subunit
MGMTIGDMFAQSGALALLGIVVVFSFLIILIILVTVSGKVIHALGLDKDTGGAGAANAGSAPAANNGAIVAAIGAALKQHRKE